MTSSTKTALTDLELDHLAIVYPGNRRYSLSDHVNAFPLVSLAEAGGLSGLLKGEAKNSEGLERPHVMKRRKGWIQMSESWRRIDSPCSELC